MNAKDKKIIEDNPNKTLYELLDLGLSEKGFEEASSIFALKSNQLQASEVVQLPSYAQPHLSAPIQVNDDMVTLLNVARGSTVPMRRTVAERWAARHPNQYKVI